MSKRNQRKKLLINRRFQLSFLLYTCGISIVIFLFCYISNHLFLWNFDKMGSEAGLPRSHPFYTLLERQSAFLDLTYIVTAVLILITLTVYGLYLSNRIAGSIYRLESFLKGRLQGKSEGAFRFRKNDYFQELEQPINELVERVKK